MNFNDILLLYIFSTINCQSSDSGLCLDIQDFLRNIPGSLLCSDLYEQWMDVMEEAESEEAEEEEQAQDITR